MTLVNADTGEVMEPLSRAESTELDHAEQVIERGLATFVDVGNALATIRDSRLYRASHGTFEDYCRQRWDISRQRAHQLIDSAEVSEALSTVVDNPAVAPANEAQARELTPLKEDPEAMAEVMDAVAEAGRVSAAKIREEVEKRRPSDSGRPRLHRIDGNKTVRRIVDIVSTLPHIVSTIPAEATFDADEADAWRADLTKAISALSALRKRLENQ